MRKILFLTILTIILISFSVFGNPEHTILDGNKEYVINNIQFSMSPSTINAQLTKTNGYFKKHVVFANNNKYRIKYLLTPDSKIADYLNYPKEVLLEPNQKEKIFIEVFSKKGAEENLTGQILVRLVPVGEYKYNESLINTYLEFPITVNFSFLEEKREIKLENLTISEKKENETIAINFDIKNLGNKIEKTNFEYQILKNNKIIKTEKLNISENVYPDSNEKKETFILVSGLEKGDYKLVLNLPNKKIEQEFVLENDYSNENKYGEIGFDFVWIFAIIILIIVGYYFYNRNNKKEQFGFGN